MLQITLGLQHEKITGLRVFQQALFSSDYGVDWELKNQLTCPNLPIVGITGGRQNGELYLHVVYTQLMGQRRHVYIYHSLDYGETFTVYHPVAIGPDPIYSNFIAEDTLVEPGDTVQFTDLSNDAETWEWDFDNDGIIDSYEQNPTYIYQDTGYYTVKLSITGAAIEDFGIRYDYIHVTDTLTSTVSNDQKLNEVTVYPNPFSDYLLIQTRSGNLGRVSIFNKSGEMIRQLQPEQNRITWNGKNDFGLKCPPGIYYIRVGSSAQKVMLTR